MRSLGISWFIGILYLSYLSDSNHVYCPRIRITNKMCQYTFYVGINVGNVFTVKHKILYAIVLPICQNLDVGIGMQKSKIHMIRYT